LGAQRVHVNRHRDQVTAKPFVNNAVVSSNSSTLTTHVNRKGQAVVVYANHFDERLTNVAVRKAGTVRRDKAGDQATNATVVHVTAYRLGDRRTTVV
jgi:hypothetical protein